MLKKQVCSDDTILTGYRPNVDLDVNQLTREIRISNKEILNPGSQSMLSVYPKPPDKKGKGTKERIYEIINDNADIFPNSESKAQALDLIAQGN